MPRNLNGDNPVVVFPVLLALVATVLFGLWVIFYATPAHQAYFDNVALTERATLIEEIKKLKSDNKELKSENQKLAKIIASLEQWQLSACAADADKAAEQRKTGK